MKSRQAWLLAAGEGRRAGGPKAWRAHEGRSLLERQLSFLAGLFPPDRIAVTIQPGWEPRCLKLHPGVRWTAVDPAQSALGALQAAARALPLDRWTFAHHVDMPVWEGALFELLAARVPAAEASGVEALAPSKDGRKGHPVLLSPALAGGLAALDPAADRLDHWLRTRREESVPVPFACIHENWNA